MSQNNNSEDKPVLNNSGRAAHAGPLEMLRLWLAERRAAINMPGAERCQDSREKKEKQKKTGSNADGQRLRFIIEKDTNT